MSTPTAAPGASSHGRIAVIGLGIMGSRFSRRLLDAGYTLRGHDPDPARATAFEEAGGTHAESPAAAVEGCDVALLSLLTSDVSRQVCLGDRGLSSASQRPLLVLDATTGRPSDGREIAGDLAAAGVEYADMTVSGNAAVAERGELVVMFGGSQVAFDRAAGIMRAIGRSAHHLGPVGAGATMKLVVNHALAVNRAALAESLVAAEMAGLDLTTTLAVLRDGVAYSRAMDLWGDRMVAADHERPNARLRQSAKDARLIAEHAAAVGAPSEFIELVVTHLTEGERSGLAEMDNSSVVEIVRRRAGIGRLPPPGDAPARPADQPPATRPKDRS